MNYQYAYYIVAICKEKKGGTSYVRFRHRSSGPIETWDDMVGLENDLMSKDPDLASAHILNIFQIKP